MMNMATSENLEKITVRTKLWKPTLDIVPPIDTFQIPGFVRWINWNGYKECHEGYDFAAYINTRGECVLGLPKDILIRAVAPGHVVYEIGEESHYDSSIDIYHDRGFIRHLASTYTHVVPLKPNGSSVKKGEVIARIHADPGTERGRLVHLHFTLENWMGTEDFTETDPTSIFPRLNDLVAQPQGSLDFRIEQLQQQPPIIIANYRELDF